MKQTHRVRTLGNLKQVCAVAIAALALLSCREAPRGEQASKERSLVEKGEESPNARILPDPLREGMPVKSREKRGEGELNELTEPRQRPLPTAWSTTNQLGEDPLKHVAPTGYRARLNVSWSPSQRSARVDEKELLLWPSFEVQFLRETSTRIARLRLIMDSAVFPFPRGTELRSRGDRHGHLLLWPDGRSYRVIPSGALRSLFNDRRVDRVPFVEASVTPPTAPSSLDADLTEPRVTEIVTPVARALLTTSHLADLPYASTLLCDTLLELIRVEATARLCPEGYMPLKFEIVWANESKLLFDLVELQPATDLEIEQFRAPPSLPIFKRGELPPFERFLLSERDRNKLLPLTHEAKGLVTAPPPAAPLTSAGTSALSAPLEAQPANEIVLMNGRDRPLFVLVGRLPLVWLGPGDRVPLLLKTSEIRVSARDFLGEYVLPEESHLAPARVHFGEAETASTTLE